MANQKEIFGSIGHNVKIYDPVTIIQPHNLFLYNHIILSEFVYINSGMGTYIGNHVHIATHSSITGGGYCIMEDFSGLSAGVRLITGSAKFNGEGLTNPTTPKNFQAVERSFIIIKKHATLATNVVVHPGVTIAEGTVVASGSIVTRDTEPWSIYMGIPAKKVKSRGSENILKMEKELNIEQNLTQNDFSHIIEELVKKEV